MSLNIKDPETHKLAQLLATETGESMTAAVTQAVRERLDRVRARKRKNAVLAELDSIAKRGAELYKGPYDEADELLYDENGLPK